MQDFLKAERFQQQRKRNTIWKFLIDSIFYFFCLLQTNLICPDHISQLYMPIYIYRHIWAFSGISSQILKKWKTVNIAPSELVRFNQKHFRWTMVGPDSWYSCFVIHIVWNVERVLRMDPPIHTEYFLSGGAMVFTLRDVLFTWSYSFSSSFLIRSSMFWK